MCQSSRRKRLYHFAFLCPRWTNFDFRHGLIRGPHRLVAGLCGLCSLSTVRWILHKVKYWGLLDEKWNAFKKLQDVQLLTEETTRLLWPGWPRTNNMVQMTFFDKAQSPRDSCCRSVEKTWITSLQSSLSSDIWTLVMYRNFDTNPL